MSSIMVPPPRTRRWTRLEYERLIELRVFGADERLELLDGQLVVREPQGSRHAGTIRRVIAVLRRALGDAWQVHPSRAVLIVEIAESSYRIDREHKASLFARAGIADYWIIDAVHDAVEVHRDPVAAPDALYGSRYRDVTTLRPPATMALLVEPARSIPVAALRP
jgi:Putative restriction endonuclease